MPNRHVAKILIVVSFQKSLKLLLIFKSNAKWKSKRQKKNVLCSFKQKESISRGVIQKDISNVTRFPKKGNNRQKNVIPEINVSKNAKHCFVGLFDDVVTLDTSSYFIVCSMLRHLRPWIPTYCRWGQCLQREKIHKFHTKFIPSKTLKGALFEVDMRRNPKDDPRQLSKWKSKLQLEKWSVDCVFEEMDSILVQTYFPNTKLFDMDPGLTKACATTFNIFLVLHDNTSKACPPAWLKCRITWKLSKRG